MIEIDKFKEVFLKNIHIAMAGKGRVLNNSEVLILGEFCKNIKLNGFVLAKKEDLK